MIEPVESPYLVPFDGSFQVAEAATGPPSDFDGKKPSKKRLKQLVKERTSTYVRAAIALGAILSASCEDDVTAPNGPSHGAVTLLVTPSDTTLAFDDTLRLTAAVLDEAGDPVPDPVVRWNLDSNSPLQALDTNGLTARFVPVFLGSAQITAETEGLTFIVNVQVKSEVESILITPDSLTLAVGDTSRLTIVVRDTTSAVIPSPLLEWFCGFNDAADCIPRGATIDSTGLVIGISPDFTLAAPMHVTARSKGVWSNTIYITVVPAES